LGPLPLTPSRQGRGENISLDPSRGGYFPGPRRGRGEKNILWFLLKRDYFSGPLPLTPSREGRGESISQSPARGGGKYFSDPRRGRGNDLWRGC